MSSMCRALLGALLCTALVGSTVTAQAAPGRVCYFGECASGTAAPMPVSPQASAAPQPEIIAEHGSWAVVSDGSSVMVVDRFVDGSKLAIVKSGGKLNLILADPRWDLSEGDSFVVKIDVDGTVYSGIARVVTGQALAIEGLKLDFLQAVYNGEKGVVKIGIRSWELTLAGAAQAIDDAAASE